MTIGPPKSFALGPPRPSLRPCMFEHCYFYNTRYIIVLLEYILDKLQLQYILAILLLQYILDILLLEYILDIFLLQYILFILQPQYKLDILLLQYMLTIICSRYSTFTANTFKTSNIKVLISIQQIFKVFKSYASRIHPFLLRFSVILPSLGESFTL